MALEQEAVKAGGSLVKIAIGLSVVALMAAAANMGWNYMQKRAEKKA